jgi:hypothetical protein
MTVIKVSPQHLKGHECLFPKNPYTHQSLNALTSILLPNMLDPKSYTVSWICAITTKYVAARAFLDKVHDQLEYISEHDNNDYTLGEVRKHNMVIAVLPNREYSIDLAANVAKDMLHSFPNIRIGLMVGISGKAANAKHDIRLGTVGDNELTDTSIFLNNKIQKKK